MSDLHELETLVASRTPIIVVESREEPRVVDLFERIASRRGLPLYRWSASEGLHRLDGGDQPPQPGHIEPPDALAHILHLTRPGLFLLLDLHPYLENPLVVRLLREIAQRDPGRAHTLVLVSPSLTPPDEIRHQTARYELAMPGPEELKELVVAEAQSWRDLNPGRKVRARSEDLEALTRHLAGLTLADARRLVRTAIYDDGSITHTDIEKLSRTKFELVDQGGVLSFEPETAGMEDVAGLSSLKAWLAKRKVAFLAQVPIAGLDPPKGILLLGVQGAGKSLAAKAVAGTWGVPLIRLDFGTLYNKYYGESERNLREALRTAGSMAPAVLWMDEIEKGIATDEEGGPSKRILGTLLTWMAEREEKVFLVATANDIQALPPEILRKGRFDEIFFVDLPDFAARERIFAIHLEKRGQDPQGFDLERLALLAEGLSGAEIEQVLVGALYAAQGTKAGLSMEHLEKELRETRPLSVLMAEKIGQLRAWAAGRTVPA